MSLRIIDGGDVPAQRALADYIWSDGSGQIMTKRRAIEAHGNNEGGTPFLKPWTTSVRIPDGDNQTLLMSPCHYLPDPLRPQPSFLILCEVHDETGKCHLINVRSDLRALLKEGVGQMGVLWGFRQVFELHNSDEIERPFNSDAFIAAEKFLTACTDAGIYIHSAQIDNPSGTWSFKVGHRGFKMDVEEAGPLLVSDHVMLARYLLRKVARDHGLTARFGVCSCFLSTNMMRSGGDEAIHAVSDRIRENVSPHPLTRALVRPCLSEDTVIELALGHEVTPGSRFGFVEVQGLGANVDPYAVATQVLRCLPTPH